MDELKDIYDRISYLRKKKVRMKDMAERCDMAPSVFSAIYTTVIPYYTRNIQKGLTQEEALDEALIWVNNVSKKKLLGSLADMKETLLAIKPTDFTKDKTDSNPFLTLLRQSMEDACEPAFNYTGIYLSYSVSSSRKAMKEEPFLIVPAEKGHYIEVIHNSVYDSTHHGYLLMNGLNHLYINFNELQYPQLALYNICLKLPMYEHPPFLRGIYTCFDYNYNPIARRIVFIKQSEELDREKFLEMKGRLITEDELTDKEKIYYRYTCSTEDVIRLNNIPQPQMTDEDLLEEKRALGFIK